MIESLFSKKLTHSDLRKIPNNWQHKASSYKEIFEKAQKESPPGINYLWICVLHSLAFFDVLFIRHAEEIVKKQIPEDELNQILGLTYFFLGMKDEAFNHLHKSVNMNPSKENLSSLAFCLNCTNDTERLFNVHKQLLEIDCNHITSLWYISQYLMDNERMDEAKPYIDKSLEVAPKLDGSWFILGEFHYAKGCYHKALANFKTAHKYSSKIIPELLGYIALCYLALDNKKKSHNFAKKALKYKPDCKAAKEVMDKLEVSRCKY